MKEIIVGTIGKEYQICGSMGGKKMQIAVVYQETITTKNKKVSVQRSVTRHLRQHPQMSGEYIYQWTDMWGLSFEARYQANWLMGTVKLMDIYAITAPVTPKRKAA